MDIIFLIPPALVVLIAACVFVYRLRHGTVGHAIVGFFFSLAIGAFVCFLLLVAWTAMYYSSGGH